MKTVGQITKKRVVVKSEHPNGIVLDHVMRPVITHRLKYDGTTLEGNPVREGGVPVVYAEKEE